MPGTPLHAVVEDRFIRNICDLRGLYSTPRLNTTLFLNDCQLTKCPSLNNFISLRSVHLNNNNLEAIPDLSFLVHLQSLYLQVHRMCLCFQCY